MIPKVQQPPYGSILDYNVASHSPRNKIQRKPEIARVRIMDMAERKNKEKASDFAGFFSPTRQVEHQSPSAIYQLNKLVEPTAPPVRNQRSTTHLNKGESHSSKRDNLQPRHRDHSISSGSVKSSNDRRLSRFHLQMKALTIQNTRIKAENKLLTETNVSLQVQNLRLNQGLSNRTSLAYSKSFGALQDIERVAKLTSTIQTLQSELSTIRSQQAQFQSARNLRESLTRTVDQFRGLCQLQREELFSLDKVNKCLEIQIRTLKKQRLVADNCKKMQLQLQSMQLDNRRLRKTVYQLQGRLKHNMLFELTPDVSERSESFLLD